MTNSDSPIGVIFDMDGVLIDSAPAHLRSWQLFAQECGGTVTERQFTDTFGRPNRDIIPMLFGPVSEARMQAIADRKEELYRELIREHPPIVTGARELVRDLHESGARLAVGSSGPPKNIELVLSAMGIAECILVVVSGDDVTRGKPDPQVFTLAAERLELAPARCVVIEDAPVGIDAARAAGARTVAVLIYHPPEAFPEADRIVARLADLAAQDLLANGAFNFF